jgi:hypothetical protein
MVYRKDNINYYKVYLNKKKKTKGKILHSPFKLPSKIQTTKNCRYLIQS